jgi:uncharacterized protein YycO
MLITLQFSTQNKIFARLIDWWTWGDYSHVDMVLPDGRWLGARYDGVKARQPYPVSKCMQVTVEAPDEVMSIALSQVGKPYDFAAILGFIVHRDWQEDDSWVCSELIAWAFKQGGYSLLNADKVNRISPRDLSLSPFLK